MIVLDMEFYKFQAHDASLLRGGLGFCEIKRPRTATLQKPKLASRCKKNLHPGRSCDVDR